MSAEAWGDPERADLDREQEEAERAKSADFVIWSGEHQAYWRPDASGYSRHIETAGRYTLADAKSLTGHCGPEKKIQIWPASQEITAKIGDAELLRRAAMHAVRRWGKRSRTPNWSRVMEEFALGSSAAIELCRRFGIDPDGKGLPERTAP